MSVHFKLRLQKSPCGPPQFEYRYSLHLTDRVSEEEFERTIAETNRILRDFDGYGYVNWGCLCFPFFGCFLVKIWRAYRALNRAREFLHTENRRFYLGRGVQLLLEGEDMSYFDSDGIYQHK